MRTPAATAFLGSVSGSSRAPWARRSVLRCAMSTSLSGSLSSSRFLPPTCHLSPGPQHLIPTLCRSDNIAALFKKHGVPHPTFDHLTGALGLLLVTGFAKRNGGGAQGRKGVGARACGRLQVQASNDQAHL